MTFQELLENQTGSSPLNRLLVVFDFFSHGRDFFSVDSYIVMLQDK